jgi:hypothetical protein
MAVELSSLRAVRGRIRHMAEEIEVLEVRRSIKANRMAKLGDGVR